MKLRHILLALMVAAIWGFNFVVIRLGLGTVPPLLLGALRFAVAALPVLVLPRPAVSWPRLIAIGMTIFVGQFGFLLPAMAHGMPSGLASCVLQAQAFFTILIAAAALGERPKARHWLGTLVAFTGLALIATTIGGDMTAVGLALSLLAALSWASGNVLLRGAGQVDALSLVSWLSLVPPLPLLALSLVFEGPAAIAATASRIDTIGLISILYQAIPTTLLGFGIWGFLLRRYTAATVAPFSLLVPIFGTLSAALVLGEEFGPLRAIGMAIVLSGLAVVALRWPAAPRTAT